MILKFEEIRWCTSFFIIIQEKVSNLRIMGRKCLQNVLVIAPSLCRVLLPTNNMAGIHPLCVKYPLVRIDIRYSGFFLNAECLFLVVFSGLLQQFSIRTCNTYKHTTYAIILCKHWTWMIRSNFFPECKCNKFKKCYFFMFVPYKNQ